MRSSRTVVDKYTSAASRWLALVARILLPAGLFALSIFGAVPHTAHAQTIDPAAKLAPDLVSALNDPTPPKVNWLKVESTGRDVKVVIMTVSADPLLTDLRSAVVAAGGSVYYMYQSVQGISAMLPGAQVLAIAARPDVDSISPNRPATKAASFLEMTSGTTNVRTTIFGVRTGYDGTGVGIAILDSGIYYKHSAFAADGGGNRVRKIVSMNNMSDGEAMGVSKWTAGVDASATYVPGSLTETTYESNINNAGDSDPDNYGHGTHVASIAGRSGAGAPETSGIAPNANLYDVKVLDTMAHGGSR